MPTKTAAKKAPARRPAAKKAASDKAPAPAQNIANHTTARHIRIHDSIWLPAVESCEDNGYAGMTDLIRDLLRDYNSGKRMQ